MLKVSVILMASGFSSRFGQDNKLLMPFGDQTVIETTLAPVYDLRDKLEIIVVTQYEAINNLFASYEGVKVVMNPYAEEGISASIRLGVQEAHPSHAYLFLPADQVGLKALVLERILEEHHLWPSNVIIPYFGDQPGSPKLFPNILRENLLSLQGDIGGRQLIKDHAGLVRPLRFEAQAYPQDIDTYESYQRLREEMQ